MYKVSLHFRIRRGLGGRVRGVRLHLYICAPIIQGTNSSLPTPSASLLLFFPDAPSMIFSKISRPFCSTVLSPSMMPPQLMSMSSSMRVYIFVLVASLMDGAG